MRKIRIDFCDFGPNTSKTDIYLYKLLQQRFDLELCDQPDFLVYCCSPGHTHRLHSCVKIFYSGESDQPDYRQCDYSLGSIKVADPRHLQFPHYLHGCDPAAIIRHESEDPRQILAAKTKFCSFVVSGYSPRKNGNRVEFFQKLARYKRVESGGRKFNNIGGPIPPGSPAKLDFIRPCKFNIAYENRALAGYTTEKIFEPMMVRSVPIYWGDPEINDHFNPRSFLNRADFPSDEALIARIIELDQDDEKYLEYLRQPYFYHNTPNAFFNPARTLDFFEKIFTQKITPVAQARRASFFPGKLFGRWQLVKRHHWHPLNPPTWQSSSHPPSK